MYNKESNILMFWDMITMQVWWQYFEILRFDKPARWALKFLVISRIFSSIALDSKQNFYT